MRLLLAGQLQRAYADLSPEGRKRVQEALRKMSADLRHPALRVRRIRGTKGIRHARASGGLRIAFETEGDSDILRHVGHY